MDTTSWRAKWISSGFEENEDKDNPAHLIRKDFRLKKNISKARLYITSHGLYEAYVNGHRVGEALFTPGWTSYHNRLQYQVYDVTQNLQNGENAIGVRLGDGWYRSPVGFMLKRNYYGKQLAVLCQLEIEYKDGTTALITSDESWKSATGAVLSSSIFDGEMYDANKEQLGWNNINFKDVGWKKVNTCNHSKKNLVSSQSVSVKRIQEIKPLKIFTTPKGETVFDFDQNLTGWVRLNIKGHKGDTITLYHAEILDKEGNFYTANLRKAKQKLQYIFKDDKRVTFEPHFTYMGFRYVKVEFNKEISSDNLTAIVIHSELEPTGTFECSNPLINQLQSNIQWSQKDNFLDIPTDCPQRDERLAWTGDAQVFAATACFNFNCAAFYTKWLADLRVEQEKDGRVPNIVPNVINGGGASGWGDAATIVPWTLYLKYGDKKILDNQYQSMTDWLSYYRTILNENMIPDKGKGYKFGDWLSFQDPKDLFSKPAYTDVDLISTAFYAYSSQLVSKAAKVLDKDSDYQYYQNQFENIKRAFQKEFLSPNGRLSSHTQTAYVLALRFGLLNDDQIGLALNYLEANIRKRKIHLSTGFLGTPYLCKVLSDNNQTHLAYQLLTQETYPSWLYPITKGATTIWEHWDGIRPDGSIEDPYMNSYNHYAYGAIGDWLYSVVAGIQVNEDEPAYKHILIKPQPDRVLNYAKASYNSVYGVVKSSWKFEDDNFKINVTIPPNTRASLYLPFSSKSPVQLGSGTYTFDYKPE
ncbi:MAG: glycoside hydrolase family 78 protein [Labilibaculum sp.]|nr:glycoside hydrolase family 78 protein [Labilibaculum sp.]MBI9057332.1 glycoside hydrolase family 78 protein [Labilibaculum sp.]